MKVTAINNNVSSYQTQRNLTANNSVSFGVRLPNIPVAKVTKEGESVLQKLGRILDCIGGKKEKFEFFGMKATTKLDREGQLRKATRRSNSGGSSHVFIYGKNQKPLEEIHSKRTQKGLEQTRIVYNLSTGAPTTIKKIDGKEAYRTKYYQNGQQV